MKKFVLTLGVSSLLILVFFCGRKHGRNPALESVWSSTAKIPIDPARWYQLNNVTSGLNGLFDGATNESVNTGWGKLLTNYDAYYPLLAGEQWTIESIRFYDGAGTNIDKPMTLFVITDQWERIPIARFIGDQYQTWVGPDPTKPTEFALKTPISNARYLVLNTSGDYPTEIELYGSYRAGQEPALASVQASPFRNKLGINGFEWNVENPEAPAALKPVDDARVNALKSFSSMRHYMDWQKLEAQAGNYSYKPTAVGGWDYDAMYERLQSEGIDVLACFQTLPDWLETTYPADGRDHSNIPARYGTDLSSPKSYIEHARVGFQYIARYGSNKQVDPSLVTVSSYKDWAGVNTVKIGLGLIRYIECNNEPDKTWKGRNGYQTAREYAADLSAFYDGHKNTLGPGVGVKNADPSVQVVIGGLSTATTDYVRGMIDWCKEFRGYRADGSVNLCWDVINQHLYANDAQSSQGGGGTRGAAPELAGVGEEAATLVKLARQYTNGMPVWITEAGYDVNQGSPFRAIPIGKKTILETQADWTLRTALLYSRVGIDRVFFFQAYDDDIQNPQQFSSMGLLNPDKTRKPAADYLYQARNLLGNYRYKETTTAGIGADNLLVDRYESDGRSAYVILIPDERGRTGSYNLTIPKGDTVQICTPTAGRDEMTRSTQVSQTGTITINASETPVFVMPVSQKSDSSPDLGLLQLFPNPATDYVDLVLENGSTAPVDVTVYNQVGQLNSQVRFQKADRILRSRVDTSLLSAGLHLFTIQQGDSRVVKKIIKLD